MDPIVTAAIIAGGASVIVALIGLFGIIIPRLWRNTHALHEVKDQILNNHGSNLRDDLDFIRDKVLEIRTDIAWLSRDHVDLAHRVALIEGAVNGRTHANR